MLVKEEIERDFQSTGRAAQEQPFDDMRLPSSAAASGESLDHSEDQRMLNKLHVCHLSDPVLYCSAKSALSLAPSLSLAFSFNSGATKSKAKSKGGNLAMIPDTSKELSMESSSVSTQKSFVSDFGPYLSVRTLSAPNSPFAKAAKSSKIVGRFCF